MSSGMATQTKKLRKQTIAPAERGLAGIAEGDEGLAEKAEGDADTTDSDSGWSVDFTGKGTGKGSVLAAIAALEAAEGDEESSDSGCSSPGKGQGRCSNDC